jgi:hypothetical protein
MKGRRKGGKTRSWRAGKKGTKREKGKNQRNGMRSQDFVVGTASLSSAIEKHPTELAPEGLRFMSCARLPTASTVTVQWVMILALVPFQVTDTYGSTGQSAFVLLSNKYSFHILYSFLLSSIRLICPPILFTSANKKFSEELITCFPLIPHGPHWKRRSNNSSLPWERLYRVVT